MPRKFFLRKISLLMATLMVMTAVMAAEPIKTYAVGVDYYVDAVNGNDSNNGLSESNPWRSLSKVNETTFAPGDKILFKAGCIWTGTLYPKGSGVSGDPIIIDRYGTGSKPIIAGNGAVTNAVYFYNQQYWEINNLEVTNIGPTNAKRQGVYIGAMNAGTLSHMYLKDLYVHDIKGDGVISSGIGYGGIVFVIRGNTVPTKWSDILVDGCTISNIEYYGIVFLSTWNGNNTVWESESGVPQAEATVWHRSDNLVISNNTLNNIGSGGITPDVYTTCTIRNNVLSDCCTRHGNVPIWWQRGDVTIVEANEVYNTHVTGGDCTAFDADYFSTLSYVQYNYSHDNLRGFFMECGTGETYNSIVRYNISQNDGGAPASGAYNNGALFNYAASSINTGILNVYNNTFYMGGTNSNAQVTAKWAGSGAASASSCMFRNNIFYSVGDKGWDSNFKGAAERNCYYGTSTVVRTDDASRVNENPLLVYPGSASVGMNTVDGYKLQAGSPCVDAGIFITDNGMRDYWNTPLYYNGRADIGACESNYTAQTNLALGETAIAINFENSSRTPSMANDGNTSTMWVAANGNPNNWWKVDLGRSQSLTGSQIVLLTSGETWKYKIEVSNDDTNWTIVADRTNNTDTAQTQTHDFAAAARYVRVTMTQCPGSRWAAIPEFKVFGMPSNIALNRLTSAINYENSSRTPAMANDGNASNMWVAANGNSNNWWKVDLGQSFNLTGSQIVLLTSGEIWKYKIEVSNDDTSWINMVDKTNNTDTSKIQSSAFAANARYVKVTMTQCPGARWAAIPEFKVFGD